MQWCTRLDSLLAPHTCIKCHLLCEHVVLLLNCNLIDVWCDSETENVNFILSLNLIYHNSTINPYSCVIIQLYLCIYILLIRFYCAIVSNWFSTIPFICGLMVSLYIYCGFALLQAFGVKIKGWRRLLVSVGCYFSTSSTPKSVLLCYEEMSNSAAYRLRWVQRGALF